MTENTELPSAKPTDTLIAPLLVWLLIQLAALAAVVFRVPFWAKYPQPPDSLATAIMLVVQNITASLLFPVLFRSFRSSFVVAATAWPMLLASGSLASTPIRNLLLAGVYQSSVFAIMALWGKVLRSRSSALGGTAIAITVVIAPAVLQYLRIEFNPDASLLDFLWRPTPIAAGLEALRGTTAVAALALLGALSIPAVVRLISMRRRL